MATSGLVSIALSIASFPSAASATTCQSGVRFEDEAQAGANHFVIVCDQDARHVPPLPHGRCAMGALLSPPNDHRTCGRPQIRPRSERIRIAQNPEIV